MQRIFIAGIAAFGVADAFRMSPKKAAVLAQGSEKSGGPVSVCSISGDPHILTFDTSMRGGHHWHPMHAPGYWWLVKTAEKKVSIQATYGNCGLKHGGGWMQARLDGIPRSCMTGIAVGGSFLEGIADAPLVIQVPCDWDWENSVCKTDEKKPIIWWNKERVDSVSANGVAVKKTSEWRYQVELPLGIKINVDMHGIWKHGISPTYMDVRIFMAQGSAGSQCGHCGNFDGDQHNDMKYTMKGELKDEFKDPKNPDDEFCNPQVECSDRLIPQTEGCKKNSDDGVEFDIDDCPPKLRVQVEEECRKKLGENVNPEVAAKLGKDLEDDQLEDCIMDGCLDKGFIDDDAEDAKEEDEEIAAKLR